MQTLYLQKTPAMKRLSGQNQISSRQGRRQISCKICETFAFHLHGKGYAYEWTWIWICISTWKWIYGYEMDMNGHESKCAHVDIEMDTNGYVQRCVLQKYFSVLQCTNHTNQHKTGNIPYNAQSNFEHVNFAFRYSFVRSTHRILRKGSSATMEIHHRANGSIGPHRACMV